MPKIDVYDIKGKKVSEVELKEEIFGITPNETVVHSVLVNYLANQRQGTQSTKTRSEVSGGGRKPWRQKGTGRARQGSIRAPQWIKGGIALGPKPRSYKYTVNKKERRLAIKSLLSSKVLENSLVVVDKMDLKEIKTKGAAACFEQFGQIFYVYAMASEPMLAAPMIASYCVISVILSRIFLKERLKASQYACVAAVIVGIILLGISEGLAEA